MFTSYYLGLFLVLNLVLAPISKNSSAKENLYYSLNYKKDSIQKTEKTNLKLISIEASINQALQANAQQKLMMNYKELGDYYLSNNNNIKKALENFEKSSIIACHLNDLKAYCTVSTKMGVCFRRLQKFDEAIGVLRMVLSIQKENNYLEDQSLTLDKIGGVYFEMNDYYNAEFFTKQAIALYESYCLYDRLAVVYSNLAAIYNSNSEDNSLEALMLYKKALKIRNNLGIPITSISLTNIGLIFLDLKKFDSTSYYLSRAKKLALKESDHYEIAWINYNFGELYLQQNKADSALVYLKKGFHYLNNTEEPIFNHFYKVLAKTYALLGQYDSAYFYSHKFVIEYPNQLKILSNHSIKKFEENYKSSRKLEQISSLKKENDYKFTIISKEIKLQRIQWISFSSLLIIISVGMYITYSVRTKDTIKKQENLMFNTIIKAEQKERYRIAQDLHDSLGQTISLVKLKCSNIIPIKNKEKQYNELLKIIDIAYDELHCIAYKVMPDLLAQYDLVEVVKEISSKVEYSSGLKINFYNTLKYSNIDLNETNRSSLYQVLQKVLNNMNAQGIIKLVEINLIAKGKSVFMLIQANEKAKNFNTITNLNDFRWNTFYSNLTLTTKQVKIISSENKGTKVLIRIPIENT